MTFRESPVKDFGVILYLGQSGTGCRVQSTTEVTEGMVS